MYCGGGHPGPGGDLRRFLSINLAVLFGFTMSLHMLTSSAEHCGFDAFAERLCPGCGMGQPLFSPNAHQPFTPPPSRLGCTIRASEDELIYE